MLQIEYSPRLSGEGMNEMDEWMYVVGEFPIWVGSPEGGLHEGVPYQWRTHEYGKEHPRMY
jgi:hypothetical protein